MMFWKKKEPKYKYGEILKIKLGFYTTAESFIPIEVRAGRYFGKAFFPYKNSLLNTMELISVDEDNLWKPE